MPRNAWVDQGSTWNGGSSDLLPVFTRPRPRVTSPAQHVGLDVEPEAVERWHCDKHRFDLNNYVTKHMITANGVLRLPSLAERERLMGFDDNYFSSGLRPKLKGAERELVGAQLIGGTFCVFSVMVLLDALLSHFGSAPGRQLDGFFTRGVAPACWTEQPVFVKHAASCNQVAALVTHFLRVAEKGGTDVRLDAGIPFRARAWPGVGFRVTFSIGLSFMGILGNMLPALMCSSFRP